MLNLIESFFFWGGGFYIFFAYGQIDTRTERLHAAKSRISGKTETTGDRIKCRLEMLRETTNWDTRRNGMKGGIVRDYLASSKGLKWLGANLNGILVFWIMTSCRWVNNYQSSRDVSCLHFRGSSSPRLTLRRLMSYIYGAPILDVSRSHTTTQHSR